MPEDVEVRTRSRVDDRALTTLHARAFGNAVGPLQPWSTRLEGHSLTWVGAFRDDELVGFVNAGWDGGLHAFLLDTVVEPTMQRQGIGRRLVGALIAEVSASGCSWLHVDSRVISKRSTKAAASERPGRDCSP